MGFAQDSGWQCRVCVCAQLQGTQSKYKVVLGSKGEGEKEEERSGKSFLLGTSILAVPFLFTSYLKKKKI